jgi:actin-related protein 8
MRACTTQVQPVAAVETVVDAPETDVKMDDSSRAPTPFATSAVDDNVAETSATFPLDAAIAASISVVGNENKAKTASSAILVIGGSSALKGLNAFLAER